MRLRRPRITIAVEPRVLGDAITSLLTSVDVDDLVSGGEDAVDAAIVSADAIPLVAPLVIEVPDSSYDGGWIFQGGERTAIRLPSTMALLQLLDERLGATSSRSERAIGLLGEGGGAR